MEEKLKSIEEFTPHWLTDVNIATFGRPNVGKSSFVNSLVSILKGLKSVVPFDRLGRQGATGTTTRVGFTIPNNKFLKIWYANNTKNYPTLLSRGLRLAYKLV